MPYKLKHNETGLYWKGGSIIPFSDYGNGLHVSCWSKNGKSWNLKQHISAAISNTLHKLYVRTGHCNFYDMSSIESTYERFSSECEIEYYQEAITIPFTDFKSPTIQSSKKVHLKIERDGWYYKILFGPHINLKKYLFYILDKSGNIDHPIDKKYTNYKRRMKR